MKMIRKTKIALGVATALTVASTGALAASAGTDLNLSAHAAAGGMGGAAYTNPQEVSAAVFGNPATLTQFPGINFNFGAALIMLDNIQVEMTADLEAGSGNTRHTSEADNYIVPTVGLGLQVSPNLFVGLGLEADAGLGADYRNDPLNLTAGVGADVTVPLLVEVISLNANLATAYKITDAWSVGASATVGFGLAQLGTAGDTANLAALELAVDTVVGADPGDAELLAHDFGGTTASVHDIAFGWSLGTTYAFTDSVMGSFTVKGPVEYKFQDIIYSNPSLDLLGNASLVGIPGVPADGWQDLDVEQPLEVIAGMAYNANGLLLEADLIWKNWNDADAYEDAYENQTVLALGAQYEVGKWDLRMGYSYATDILADSGEANNTLGNLVGLGTIPLGTGAEALDGAVAIPIVSDLADDVIELVQMSLLPVLWQHTITAGVGYDVTDAVRLDAFASYSFGEEDSRSLETLAGAGDIALGGTGFDGESITAEQNLGPEIFIGAGINVALP